MNSPRHAVSPSFFRRWWFQITLLLAIAALATVLLVQTL